MFKYRNNAGHAASTADQSGQEQVEYRVQRPAIGEVWLGRVSPGYADPGRDQTDRDIFRRPLIVKSAIRLSPAYDRNDQLGYAYIRIIYAKVISRFSNKCCQHVGRYGAQLTGQLLQVINNVSKLFHRRQCFQRQFCLDPFTDNVGEDTH